MDNVVQKIKERLQEEMGEAAALLKAAFQKLKSFKLAKAVVLAYDAVTGVVNAVEEIAHELGGVTGAQKKQAATEFLNEAIDIPLVPEFIEAWVFGFCIDQAVAKLNSLYQKTWFARGIERAKLYFAHVQGALELEGE